MEKSVLHLLRRFSLPLLTLAASYLVFVPQHALAAGSIYLSPASKTVSPGMTFSVQVRENSGGDNVNAVEAHLSYPSDKIDYVSYSGGSAFPIEAPSSGGGGNVSISRGVIGAGLSGDNLIASVSFRVRAGVTGAIAINVTSGSLVRGSDQVNVLSGKSGANYNSIIPTPVPTKKPTPTPTPPPSTPPAISKVTVTAISYTSATITWETDRPASSIVLYGLNNKYGLSNSQDTLVTSHKVVLDSALLTPGTTYHYQAKSIDQWGNQGVGADATFSTAGYTLTLTVEDDKGNPLVNTSITLVGPSGSKKGTTDAEGKVTFKDLTPGSQNVVADAPGAKAASVTVGNQPTQAYQVRIAGASSSPASSLSSSMLALLLGLCIILPLLVFGFIRLVQWLKNLRTPPGNPTGPPASTPVTGDSSGSQQDVVPLPVGQRLSEEAAMTIPPATSSDSNPISAPADLYSAHDLPASPAGSAAQSTYTSEPAHNPDEQFNTLERHMEENI